MVDYIMQNIKPPSTEYKNDIPWWMGSTQGKFTVSSTWNCLRRKKGKLPWCENIWIKAVPFKISFFMWRVWRKRIATYDNLRRMRINIVSRCCCCEAREEETIRLWRHFASCAGISMEYMNLQYVLNSWWTQEEQPKLRFIFKSVPALIMWNVWKRRNNIKHAGNTSYNDMILHIQNQARKVIKGAYPWIKLEKESWRELILKLRRYKRKLYHLSVTWKKPEENKLKCNTDGACKGNPGMSSFGYCIRNSGGDIIYAKAKRIGEATNTEAELQAVQDVVEYCRDNNLFGITFETDSLSLKNMILGEWKVPWEMIEQIEEVKEGVHFLGATVQHTFREGNSVADSLANEVIVSQHTKEYHSFQDLPVNIKRNINLDKNQIPTLRIRTRKIRQQQN